MKKLDPDEQAVLLDRMLQCARIGRAMGYKFEVKGWTMRIVRPDGTLAIQCTARDQEQLAELEAIARANQ